MINKLWNFFKEKKGLALLLLILSIITIANLKPDFYLLGWDNYSSYFNLKTNIFRTFFATWREYRGLGVPSDAEVTDIFRQIFYWFAHFIFPEQLLDQVYHLIALWIGVLSMYGLTRILFNKEKYLDLFGMITSLFYLFNLNTLSVFYSPIIPFTNRFFTLPLMLYLFLKFINKKNKKNFFLLFITILLASGSYITPTLIITSTIAIFIFLFFRLDFKKSVIYLTLYLLLNSFWLLPFFNYTIQKSSIVPLARTFIEINESTLNRNPSTFSLEKQAILFPSFLDINFSSQNSQAFTIHPQLYEFGRDPIRFILFLFPFLYGIGSLFILLNWRKSKKILWIPFWILIFLFLSTKEYGLFGFVYSWLKKIIPFFEVIFRISDTKFHAYISIAGSLAASYTIISIFSFLIQKHFRKLILITLILVSSTYIWLFRSYFNGNLIGFFAYTKIPQAYFDVAKVINENPEKRRVLHLPMDQWQHYWRSFSWGYLGSSFFNFFIDKPYIDKTFEPASMENTFLHAKLNNLLDKFYRTTDLNQKNQTAEEFLAVLKKTGTQYVLVDESISSDIYPRNLVYTARQSYIKSKEMMDYLSQANKVNLISDYSINLQELYQQYEKLYPVNKTGLEDNLPVSSNVYLYEIIQPRPVFSLAGFVLNIDPDLNNLLETQVGSIVDGTIIQDQEKPAQLIPFIQQNHTVSKDDQTFTLEYKNPNSSSLRYQINTTPSNIDSYLIDLYGNIKDQKLNLSFYHRYYPDINGQRFQQYLGSLSFPISESRILDQYRLKLNDVFTPIPSILSNNDSYISSYVVHERIIKAALLQKSGEEVLNFQSFSKTNPTSCYGPQLEGYEENTEITNNSLVLQSKKGSICVESAMVFPDNIENKPQYAEIELTLKSNLTDDVPMQGYVCVYEGAIPDCLNLHRHLRLFSDAKSYRLPLVSYVTNQSGVSIQIGSIPQQNTDQTVNIEKIIEHFYEPLQEQEISFDPVFPQETVNISGPLQISFPKAQSPYSYFHDPENELFDLSQNPCRGDKTKTRTMKFISDTLYNSMENCDVFFAQKFKYVFGHPYLFAYQYLLESGQQPNILLGREGDNYLLEKASLYQGYPNLKGKLTYASRLLELGAFSDTFSKDMSIHITQDTANTGILAVRSFDMVEYPASWYYLTLTPINTEKTYSNSANIIYKQLLPSLWKVEIDNADSENLLIFNEGYDKQWGIYDSLFDLIFGKSKTKNIRCDGYANCFAVSSPSFYVFYWPERLYLFGWLLTILTIIFSLKFFNKDPLKIE